jgi:hypothetical protein
MQRLLLEAMRDCLHVGPAAFLGLTQFLTAVLGLYSVP